MSAGAQDLSKRRIAAYHEAGHAVAAHVLGRKIVSVSVEPDADEGSGGRLTLTQEWWPGDNYEPGSLLALNAEHPYEYWITILLAGGIAQRIGTGTEPAFGHTVDDHTRAAEIALSAVDIAPEPSDISALQKRARLRTEKLIEDHWGAVEALTTALLERQTLSGEEVRQVIADALTGSQKGA